MKFDGGGPIAMEETVGTTDAETAVEAETGVEAGTVEVGTVDVGTVEATTVTYPIAPGYQVNVRSGPSTTSKLIKVLPYNTRVPIRCQRRGQKISGPYGTTDIWDSIAPGQYVSDAFVKTGSDGFITVICAG
ncbi:SH3 domain-containing protein [Streptomyces sp. NBS 14/10]|nr:SH3 domain-containing protein [Streptomyces sp. NBS 14/10]KAK1180184.1 SH3 domain-containing protein [Streptomyces sp. NBS 14/10]